MFGEVPVLPVVVPVAMATFAVLLGVLRRRDRLSMPRAAVALALCVYAAGVVANTVFPIFLDKPSGNAQWSLNLVPLAGYEVADAVMNMVVFAPLGILLPLLLAGASWRLLVAVAATSSLAIELSQLVSGRFLGGGHVADVNDLIFNVAGASLGLGLYSLVRRVPTGAAALERFRWS